jgi:hypothetical protein
MRNFVAGLLLLFPFCLWATKDSALRYANAIYEKDIRTVKMENSTSGFPFPLVQMGEAGSLKLEFDQLTDERDYYQYTLVHCDALWNPSALQKNQYLNGQGYENIESVTFSNGTLMKFVHYEAPVPSANTTPKISGNYLLTVYRNYDETDIVLSRRLVVLDMKGRVDLTVIQSSQVELRPTHQQVNFNFVLTDNYFMPKPYQDLKAVILRNGEWITANTGLAPQFISGNSYNYQYQTGNQFEGLNEFRFFDIRSFRQSTAGVKQRFNVAGQKHIVLINDQTRRFDRYFNWADYNGRYFLFSRDIPLPSGASAEGDYCFVHFTLKSDEELKNKKVFVYGELSDWRIHPDCEMFYNPDNKTYEAVIPLKQAYYNYSYAVYGPADGSVDTRHFEGSHSETENNYMVLMYHRNQTMNYDELIGYGLENTRGKR